MIDLPANILEEVQNIDWDEVKAKVQDYGPALAVLQGTWSHETLAEILQGNLYVPDTLLNEALAKQFLSDTDGSLKSLEITSHKNGRLDIVADTEKIGKIELSGEIKEFTHDTEKSVISYRVRERNLPSHGLLSWIVSRISLSFAEQLFGKLTLADSLPMRIKGNTVTIDCRELLQQSDFGQTYFHGYRLLDLIEIKGATPKENGIMFLTEINAPDDLKKELLAVINKR